MDCRQILSEEFNQNNLLSQFLNAMEFNLQNYTKIKLTILIKLHRISSHLIDSMNFFKHSQISKRFNDSSMKEYISLTKKVFKFSEIYINEQSKKENLKICSFTLGIWRNRFIQIKFLEQNLIIQSKSNNENWILDLNLYEIKWEGLIKFKGIYYFSLISKNGSNKILNKIKIGDYNCEKAKFWFNIIQNTMKINEINEENEEEIEEFFNFKKNTKIIEFANEHNEHFVEFKKNGFWFFNNKNQSLNCSYYQNEKISIKRNSKTILSFSESFDNANVSFTQEEYSPKMSVFDRGISLNLLENKENRSNAVSPSFNQI